MGAVERSKEVPDAVLGEQVQPDRGLVEDEQVRVVEDCGGKITAHALTQGELPDRRGKERVEVENLAGGRQVLREAITRNPVHVPQQV